jgi:hypothetical protein
METITAASQALLLPPVVSIASKYIDVPEFIVEASKPPTGQSLMKIKGILPQVINQLFFSPQSLFHKAITVWKLLLHSASLIIFRTTTP